MLNYNCCSLQWIFNDAPHVWQIGFQDSASPGFTGIVELHNTILFYVFISTLKKKKKVNLEGKVI